MSFRDSPRRGERAFGAVMRGAIAFVGITVLVWVVLGGLAIWVAP